MDLALKPGLYVVATPIGNRRDITLRACDVLQACTHIVCENKYASLPLLDALGIKRKPIVTYNEYAGTEAKRTHIINLIIQGQALALISDAGTPLICDPGYKLVQAVRAKGLFATTIPGPCALVGALTLSGLPVDTFTFGGFLPPRSARRQKALKSFKGGATLIFYEAPHRLLEALQDMITVFGPTHGGCVVRELTKIFEDVQMGPLQDLLSHYTQHPDQVRGEIVILLEPVSTDAAMIPETIREAMRALIQEDNLSIQRAIHHLHKLSGVSRTSLYRAALAIK